MLAAMAQKWNCVYAIVAVEAQWAGARGQQEILRLPQRPGHAQVTHRLAHESCAVRLLCAYDPYPAMAQRQDLMSWAVI